MRLEYQSERKGRMPSPYIFAHANREPKSRGGASTDGLGESY